MHMGSHTTDLPRCAESKNIIRGRASQNTSGIVVSIAVRGRASLLENPGIVGRHTRYRIRERPSAAVLVGIKHVTRTPTRYHLPVGLLHELLRAIRPQIAVASRHTAIALCTCYRTSC